jgi:hypothetical protein
MEVGDLLFGPVAGDDGQEKKTSPLISLQKDLDFYAPSIQEVADEIIAAELSQYPIFVAHQHVVQLGEKILDKDELGTNWTIHAATLEEFVAREIIKPEKKDRFIKFYKNPKTHMCLFVIVPAGANFVFYPYKNEEN